MTFAGPLTILTFQQAFLKLDATIRMWIQTKAQMYVSLGRFGATEINLFKQQIITRYGAAATTGSPSLVEIAIWYVLQKVALAAFGSATGSTSLALQSMQQSASLQTLSNVSRLLHDTSMSIINNLR